jgi:hypothetical protein
MRPIWSEIDPAAVPPPPRFTEAVEIVRAAIRQCEQREIPVDSILAALMTELLPRLVAAYGPQGVAGVFGRLAGEIATGGAPRRTRQ